MKKRNFALISLTDLAFILLFIVIITTNSDEHKNNTEKSNSIVKTGSPKRKFKYETYIINFSDNCTKFYLHKHGTNRDSKSNLTVTINKVVKLAEKKDYIKFICDCPPRTKFNLFFEKYQQLKRKLLLVNKEIIICMEKGN